MAQLGFLFLAAGLAYVGIKGLLGKPDRDGQATGLPVAIACLVLAAGAVVFALVILPRL